MNNIQNLDELTKAAISTFLQYEQKLKKLSKTVTTSKKTRIEYVQLAKYLLQKRSDDPLHQYRTPKKLSKLTPEVIHEQETNPTNEQKIYSRV